MPSWDIALETLDPRPRCLWREMAVMSHCRSGQEALYAVCASTTSGKSASNKVWLKTLSTVHAHCLSLKSA